MASGGGRSRPLSQQLAPEELTLSDRPICRDVLERRSIRQDRPVEKHLPQYPSLHKHPPQQQFAPAEHATLTSPHVPNDVLQPDILRGPPPKKQHLLPQARVAPLAAKPGAMSQKSDSNGDLPNDQVIPLEELPRDQNPHYSQPPLPETSTVDDQPLLRRPRRRRKDPAKSNKNDGYNVKAALCIGIILIIIGILEILLNSAGLVLQELFRTTADWNIIFYLAPGIWCSIFLILCGVFGVLSARHSVTWAIVTHLVTSTLASVFSVILLVLCGLGIHREVTFSFQPDIDLHLPSLIILCVMTLLALMALPLALCASILCCQVFCRKQPTT